MRYLALIPVILALVVLGWIQLQQSGQPAGEASNEHEGSRLSAAEHDKALKAFPFRADVVSADASGQNRGKSSEASTESTKL